MVRLQKTAQDLLTLTRVRSGVSQRSHAYAAALAEEATAGMLNQADAAGATLTVEVPSDMAVVDVAEGDIVRALRNLIGNALIHGLGERRDVVVAVTGDADTVTLSVADSGPGLNQG
jgi:signal transduction histidine kinase